MAQADYVIADQAGVAFLSDLNNQFAAAVTNNSGATEPATTYAYMEWADTANDIMKQRNTANSAWVNLFTLSTGAPLADTGKVLQVVSNLVATQGSQTITTTDSVVNGITDIVTPKGANSSFLVTVRWFGEVGNAWDVPFNLHMDGVRVNVNGQGRGYGLAMPSQSFGQGADDDSTPETVNFSTLVETSSVVGTPITFRLVADSNSNRTLWNNRCFSTGADYERGTSEIIITEIGA